MLVRAFEIEIGAAIAAWAAPRFEREDVGPAAVEPHVENVGDALVIGEVVIGAEQRLAASSDHASAPCA